MSAARTPPPADTTLTENAAPWSTQASADRAPLPLTEVPTTNYVVEGEQGRGGIGVVLRARDRRLDRPVALKQLQRLDANGRERFEREMRITARLQHPGVVPVHEAGYFANGEPFYAMKLVEGRSLKELIAEKRTLDERLALLPHVLAVAETIAYAHSKRIIHRDLKPSNVIVGEYGETVVIDWGLAKDLDVAENAAEVADGPFRTAPDCGLTVDGQVLGTPAYMPPEQARSESTDERADVYSLGAILFHLLCGSPPYPGSTSAEVLANVLRAPPVDVQERQAASPADLCAIVTKAMSRDVAARYPHARALAEDLRRFQSGQLVSAHRYSTQEVLARWLRRHRGAVTVAGIGCVILATLGAIGIQRVMRERNVALHEKHQATLALEGEREAMLDAERRTNSLLLSESQKIVALDPTRSIDLLARRSHSDASENEAVRELAEQAYARGVSRFLYVRAKGMDVVPLGTSADGERLALAGDSLQVWETRSNTLRLDRALTSPVFVLQFGPDSSFLASGHEDGSVLLWDLTTGNEARLGDSRDMILDVAFSGDGRRLAAGDKGGLVQLVDLQTRRVVMAKTLGEYVDLVRFSADGNHLVVASGAGELAVLDLATMQWTEAAPPTELSSTSALVDRGRAIASWDGRAVTVCPIAGSACRRIDMGPRDGTVQFASGSPRMMLCDTAGRIQVLDYDNRTTRTLYRGDRGIICGAVTLDGRYVLGGRADGTVILARTEDGATFEYHGHSGSVQRMAFVGESLAPVTSAEDGSLRIWTAPLLPRSAIDVESGPLQYAGFSPLGSTIAVRATDALMALWYQDGRPTRVLELDSQVVRVRFSPDDKFAYTSHFNGALREVDCATGRVTTLAQGQGLGAGLELSRSGRYVATSSSLGEIILWDRDRRVAMTLRGNTAPAYYLLFTSDETTLVSATSDGEVRSWDIATGSGDLLYVHGSEIRGVDWLNRDHVLLTASDDGLVRSYDLDTRRQATFAAHTGPIARFVVSDGGQRVAAVSTAAELLVWDASGRLLMAAHGVSFAASAPDGRLMAIGYKAGVLSVVDPTRPDERGSVLAHPAGVVFVEFSKDGQSMVTAGIDGFAKKWSVEDFSMTHLDRQLTTITYHASKGEQVHAQ